MRERTFTQADLIGDTNVPPGPGYLTYTRAAESGESPCGLQQQHPKRRGVEGGRQPALVAERLRGGGTVWWTPCPRQTVVRQALAASADGAVEVCPHGAGDGATGLGLALARHLARHRARHGAPGGVVGPCSLTPPAPPPQTVRLPHLIHADIRGGEQDRVVWEILSAADASTWLGRPLHQPDLDYLEQHLPQLLEVKRRHRIPGGLQPSAAQWRLSRLLDEEGRYVSIWLALYHIALFRTLITEIAEEATDELLD